MRTVLASPNQASRMAVEKMLKTIAHAHASYNLLRPIFFIRRKLYNISVNVILFILFLFQILREFDLKYEFNNARYPLKYVTFHFSFWNALQIYRKALSNGKNTLKKNCYHHFSTMVWYAYLRHAACQRGHTDTHDRRYRSSVVGYLQTCTFGTLHHSGWVG